MPFYDFEYFAGSNVIVKVNSQACLEAAAISYNYMDSKQPIYGYSSQLFDAVAPGQKLVQGSIVINYVYDNYLYDCITRGLAREQGRFEAKPLPEPQDLTENQSRIGDGRPDYTSSSDLADAIFVSPGGLREVSSDGKLPKETEAPSQSEDPQLLSSQSIDYEALDNVIQDRLRFWDLGAGNYSNEQLASVTGLSVGGKYFGSRGREVDPLSMGRGVEIQINYGNRGEYLVITGVHFIGRASAIQIDENVIVEEYSFFARQLRGSPSI